jgi:hypothetical protein
VLFVGLKSEVLLVTEAVFVMVVLRTITLTTMSAVLLVRVGRSAHASASVIRSKTTPASLPAAPTASADVASKKWKQVSSFGTWTERRWAMGVPFRETISAA